MRKTASQQATQKIVAMIDQIRMTKKSLLEYISSWGQCTEIVAQLEVVNGLCVKYQMSEKATHECP